MSRDEVLAAFEMICGKPPGSEHQIHVLMRSSNMADLIRDIVSSNEFNREIEAKIWSKLGQTRPNQFDEIIQQHKDCFLCPSDLTVTPLPMKNVLLLGQCFFFDWKSVAEEKKLPVRAQQFVVNNIQEIPDSLFDKPNQFDFQVMQVPMRAAIPEDAYFRIGSHDKSGFDHLFKVSKERTASFVEAMMKFNRKFNVETYVCNFISPQTGFLGRFAERYELSNILYYVEELNKFLFDLVKIYNNAYYVDLNALCAAHGKLFSRDDFFAPSMHGGTATDGDAQIDAARIVVPPPASQLYYYNHMPFVYGAWREIIAMHRTLHALDAVKMVVIDLDDTLWRGLIGEGTAGDIEGWPAGFIEALLHLKNRGILLAIISKNDEAIVLKNWTKILGAKIALEDFALRRINYSPKPINMSEILAAANLLSRNVVFVDDNPVEREAMKGAFPDMRVLGDLPLYFKRILMWSAETQTSYLSDESARRTEMIQAQVARDSEQSSMTRDEFLSGLGIEVEIEIVSDSKHRKFPRSFELINKTNQFNTTGLRLAQTDALTHFDEGGVFYVFTVRDKHTAYGLVGVLVVKDGMIEQFVMSCRVAGLDIELGVLSALADFMRRDLSHLKAKLKFTDVNLLCREVYSETGFVLSGGTGEDGIWELSLSSAPLLWPPHLKISIDDNFLASRDPSELVR